MCHNILLRFLACSFPGCKILLLGFLLIPAQALFGQTNLFENFSSDPRGRGWVTFGHSNLFSWNREAQSLEVTWDSSQPNSFFYYPLNQPWSRQDDFQLGFDLRLDGVRPGINPNKTSTFQISAGLISVEAAFRPNFYRASGTDPLTGPRDLIEFDYFPDTGFGATIAPTLISSNTQFATTFNFPLELKTGVWYRVTMAYTAHNSTLATAVRAGPNEIGSIREVRLPAEFTDFSVNALAINSYSDEGQTPPEFAGSILAQGAIDNFAWASQTPIAPLTVQTTEEKAQVQFLSRRNWRYVLQRTTDFKTWADVSGSVAGTGEKLTLEDARGSSLGFYRVRADR